MSHGLPVWIFRDLHNAKFAGEWFCVKLFYSNSESVTVVLKNYESQKIKEGQKLFFMFRALELEGINN